MPRQPVPRAEQERVPERQRRTQLRLSADQRPGFQRGWRIPAQSLLLPGNLKILNSIVSQLNC